MLKWDRHNCRDITTFIEVPDHPDLCWCHDMETLYRYWSFAGHYDDVIMGAMAYQITSLTIVYSTVYSDADQRKHQSSASLAFVRGIRRRPVNSPHKWPVTRKMFPFDDVIMVRGIHRSSVIGGFRPRKASNARFVSSGTLTISKGLSLPLTKCLNIPRAQL